MRTTQHSDRSTAAGQILVLFAGGLVALLLIGSLVVDLGMVFMQRRQEQNAADPGALAAARYLKPTADTGKMWTAACFYAIQNGYRPTRTDTTTACDSSIGTDGSSLTVHWPPSAAAGEYAGNKNYVEVTVAQPHTSLLAGIIGITTFNVATSAVAANDDGTGGSSSLIALDPHACSAGNVHGGGGGGGVNIFPATGVSPGAGGFVQINSDCGTIPDNICSNDSKGALTVAGGTYLTTTGGIYIQGTCDTNGAGATVSPAPHEGASFVGDPLSVIRPPAPTDLVIRQACGGTPSTAASPKTCVINSTTTLLPGTYYGGWKISGASTQVSLQPGIYVIAGGGVSDNAELFTSASGRVMIFSTDASQAFKTACASGTAANQDGCQNKISLAGGSTLNLVGLDGSVACPPYSSTGCPFGGMLIWQDGHGSAEALFESGVVGQRCDVYLGGSSSLYLSGTIYAACGLVKINGNNSTSGCDLTAATQDCAAVQIISNTWDVGGSAVLQMPYDPKAFYHLALKGLVR